MNTIPDSNVVLDVIAANPEWADWSARELEESRKGGVLVINPIVYAEISGRILDVGHLEQLLRQAAIEREGIPWAAAYLAGRAHYQYRRSGGERDRVLPDFLVGGHAAASGYRILTRDPRRYRTFFPAVAIIAPDTHP